MVTKFAELA